MRTKPRWERGKLSPASLRGHSVLQPPSSSNSRSQSPSCSSIGLFPASSPRGGASPSIPAGISCSIPTPAPAAPAAAPGVPPEPLQHICASRGHGILAPDLARVPLNALHGRAVDVTHLAAPFNFLLTSFLFLCHFKTFANSCCCSQLFLAPSPPKDVGFEYISLSV